MATITISNLQSNDSELLPTSESYLRELSEEELGIQGGFLLLLLLLTTPAY